MDKLNLPPKYGGDLAFVQTSDSGEAAEYGLDPEVDLPKIVLFENGIPEIYDDGRIFIMLISFFILYEIHINQNRSNEFLKISISIATGGFKDLNPFKSWLKDELENKDVEVVEMTAVEKVAKTGKALLVVFVEEGGKPLDHKLEEAIKRVCDRFDIGIVKVDEKEAAVKYGIDEFPTMVYFEDGIPTIFEDEDDDGKYASHQIPINLE